MHPKRHANPEARIITVGDKQMRALQKAAWSAGWWAEKKKSGIMWLCPDGEGHVMIHDTASDHRAVKNVQALFRGCGLDV